MPPPRQAVILAGGRGARLRPLTDDRPKPMLDFHGRPFLEYVLRMLRANGIERVLLLTGYKAESIEHYFGDGAHLGLRIHYSVSPETDETARRVQRAAASIEPVFLLLYCDNYWPLRLDDMWHRFEQQRAPAMLTVYRNRDGYTRSNVRVSPQGLIEAYDKSRTAADLQGVEIGFGIFEKSVLAQLSDDNVSLEATLYPRLVEQRQLSAYVTDHRYYSVGSLARLPATAAFLAQPPSVILDRDGVLNRKAPPAQYVRSWSEFEWLPGAREALRLLTQHGYRTLIASNQAGIARGMLTEDSLRSIHANMVAQAAQVGARIDRIYYCAHHWNDGCDCRKPSPGLLLQAQHDWDLDLSQTLVIGDDERDMAAASAAGCPSLLVTPERSLLDIARSIVDTDARHDRAA